MAEAAQPSLAPSPPKEPAPKESDRAIVPGDGDAGVSAAQSARPASSGDTSPAAAAEPPPCSEDMALVGRFCVDRYEAHLVVDAGGVFSPHPHWKRPEPGVRYVSRSAPGVFPQAYISRVEAKAACEASGKRLCTRREWLRACQGKGSQMYPYGPRGRSGQCNTGKIHLLVEVFGHNPRGGFKYDEHFNSPELDQKPGFLARAGEYSGCAGEFNIFDMVGNLHEWVSDMVDLPFLDQLEAEDVERREQPWHEGNGVFMGGFFSTTSELGPGCYFTTVAHEPSYHDYSTGFRCCAAARPSGVIPASKKKGRSGA